MGLLAMNAKDFQEWVMSRRALNPTSANRVLAASNGVPAYWQGAIVGLGAPQASAAAMAAMELQIVLETFADGRHV